MSQTDKKLQTLLAPYAGRGRDALLPILWDIQTAQGYISAAAVPRISHRLRVPEADIYGVISFYSLFYEQPSGETILRVCGDPSCALQGSDECLAALRERLGVNGAGMSADGRYRVERAPCLGLCEHAPAALITRCGEGERAVAPIISSRELLSAAANDFPTTPPYPQLLGEERLALLVDAEASATQIGPRNGDYAALRYAIRELTPEQVIERVEESGLVGRGGAAFPTGVKWRGARFPRDGRPRYVICNADESEPGTFKDRALMETCPHLVLEGLALAAYACGAERGFVFIRGEYPHAQRRLQEAIAAAEAAGMLGADIEGSGHNIHFEIRRGAGAYICGEESALFEAIEGKRGFPRIKPPYPTTRGLFQQPTIVNNVETLAAIPGIVREGPAWFRTWGSEKSPGPKLLCVSGHVARPGVYEIDPGISLRDFLVGPCGGVVGELQAVLMGGAAGTFLTPAEIDVSLTFEALWEIGSTFGSGAIFVCNDTVDLRDVLQRLAHFFQHESCGKCFPCQLGTQRQLEILLREEPLAGDASRLQDIGWTMTESSLCGLGQTASSALLSAMERWPALFEAKGE